MSARAQSAGPAGEIRGLMAPTAQGEMLLPSTAVAEVVAYSGEARSRSVGPPWFVGELDWRGQRVPVVDPGRVVDGVPRTGSPGLRRSRPCVLIAFSPNGNRALPYFGFLVADSPHLVRVHAADLAPEKVPQTRPFVLYALEFQGRPAWVPDLDEVERQLLQLGLHGT